MRGAAGHVATLADRQPSVSVFATWAVTYIGLRVWSELADAPVLLARAEPGRRDDVFTQVGSSSTALLAVSLTVLAILYALPDRPAIREAREGDTWPALQGLLLTVALLCLVALVCAHIGLALDHGKPGMEWLEQLMLTSAAVATLALLVAGLVFAAVLYVGSLPPDPSASRGSLAGRSE